MNLEFTLVGSLALWLAWCEKAHLQVHMNLWAMGFWFTETPKHKQSWTSMSSDIKIVDLFNHLCIYVVHLTGCWSEVWMMKESLLTPSWLDKKGLLSKFIKVYIRDPNCLRRRWVILRTSMIPWWPLWSAELFYARGVESQTGTGESF